MTCEIETKQKIRDLEEKVAQLEATLKEVVGTFNRHTHYKGYGDYGGRRYSLAANW